MGPVHYGLLRDHDHVAHGVIQVQAGGEAEKPPAPRPRNPSSAKIDRGLGELPRFQSVQSRLPALATYLGHIHYTTTAYYLTATPELMALAAERAQHHASALERGDER